MFLSKNLIYDCGPTLFFEQSNIFSSFVWLIGFWEDFSKVSLNVCMWKSDPTPGDDDLKNLEYTRPKDAFTQVLAFFCKWFLKGFEKCHQMFNNLKLCSLLRRRGSLFVRFYKLEFPFPTNDLCYVWLKLVSGFREEGKHRKSLW